MTLEDLRGRFFIALEESRVSSVNVDLGCDILKRGEGKILLMRYRAVGGGIVDEEIAYEVLVGGF